MGLNKCSVDFSEVAAVIVECDCGCSVSYKVKPELSQIHAGGCPQCGKGAANRLQENSLGNLYKALADLKAQYDKIDFRVRLEIKD